MAELADALVSGTSARKGMGVRLPLSAFIRQVGLLFAAIAELLSSLRGCRCQEKFQE